MLSNRRVGIGGEMTCNRFTRLISPHDRYTVTNRIGKLVGIADQFLRFFIEHQRAFAQWAHQNSKQSAIHVISPK